MRVAIAQIIQESNSFAPFVTTREHFAAQYIRTGDTVLRELGDARVEITGMLSVLTEAGAEVAPLLATHGSCGGPLTRDCFNGLLDDLLGELEKAGPVDGVLLALHGSMAAEDENDCESEILEKVRALLPAGTPVGVSLDLHGHVTPRMLQDDAFFVGYGAYPHIDMFETGERTAQIMLDRLSGKVRPVMALAKRPMIISPVNGRTTEGPMTAVVAEARRMERDGEVLAASYFMVQPWLDFEDIGFAALVCADGAAGEQAAGQAAAGQAAADTLADMTWDLREELMPSLTSLEETIKVGLAGPGTTIVGDCGDAVSGGAGGDNATVLRTLLALGADQADGLTYLTLVDAPAAAQAATAGVGSSVTVRLGHTLAVGDGETVTVTATVRALTDGVFTMGAGLAGAETNFGLTAVLAVGSLRVAVRSVGGLEWDTGQYTSVGLDLSKAGLIFVKSPSHFRATFSPHADRILTADTPGAARVNIREVAYRNVRRPIHPLDMFEL
jgi:microcystin degradation protein MlrC